MLNARSLNKLSQFTIAFILMIFCVMCIFPVLYVVAVSITPVNETLIAGVVLIPHSITFEAYRQILVGHGLGNAYQVTVLRTIAGTALNLLFTIVTAYPLSRKRLPGRSGFLLLIIFTMLFSGGLIPTY